MGITAHVMKIQIKQFGVYSAPVGQWARANVPLLWRAFGEGEEIVLSDKQTRTVMYLE